MFLPGIHGYLPRYFLGISFLAIQSVVTAPAGVFFGYLLKPCMPPAFMSMALLPCYDWDDVTINSLINVVLAMLGAYLGALVSSTLVFTMIALLVYPIEVQLLILKEFKR